MSERTPLEPPRTPADPVRVLAVLGRQLAAEELALGYASDEEIEAYVDGLGDPTERALFEERLARDPALAAVVRDLTGLRAELEAASPPAVVLPFRRREVRRRLGWVAAAAAALVAGLVALPALRRAEPAPAIRAEPDVTASVPAEPQVLFADGFEAGDSASWSRVASGG